MHLYSEAGISESSQILGIELKKIKQLWCADSREERDVRGI